MNCSPTLTADEFKVLHNTLWELDRIDNPTVQTLVERIRRVALKGAYEQDNRAFTRKHDHYDGVRQELGLQSRWSLYEVDNLYDPHPYIGAEFLVYDNHWGGQEVVKPIIGLPWAALYVAADAAIRDSGDGHHVFVERFYPITDKPGHLRLVTGS
jgi:hypothetical protein